MGGGGGKKGPTGEANEQEGERETEKGRKRSVGHSHSGKKRLDRVEGTSSRCNLVYQVDPYKTVEFGVNRGFWDFPRYHTRHQFPSAV